MINNLCSNGAWLPWYIWLICHINKTLLHPVSIFINFYPATGQFPLELMRVNLSFFFGQHHKRSHFVGTGLLKCASKITFPRCPSELQNGLILTSELSRLDWKYFVCIDWLFTAWPVHKVKQSLTLVICQGNCFLGTWCWNFHTYWFTIYFQVKLWNCVHEVHRASCYLYFMSPCE